MAWTTADGGHESNSISHGDKLGGPVVSLYSTDTTQQLPLGYRIADDSGRVFRYAHFVSAVGPGKLAAIDTSVGIQASINGKLTDSAASAKDDYGTGDSTIYLTDTDSFGTSDAADVFAGGFLQITDAAGEGYNYRIKSNDVGTSAGLIRLDLYDNLAAALDSETSVAIIGNPYKNLAVANAGTDDCLAGVAVANAGAAEFGWVQTWGVCNVLGDGAATIAAGTIAVLSDDDDGGVQPIGGASFNSQDDIALSLATEPVVGYFMTAITDGEYGPVYLQLCA